jgi:hypothetical protein
LANQTVIIFTLDSCQYGCVVTIHLLFAARPRVFDIGQRAIIWFFRSVSSSPNMSFDSTALSLRLSVTQFGSRL